jgi:hypothetical protein
MHGLTGAGLAAFTACRRLRDITLPYSADLDAQQVVAQLARLTSLTSIDVCDDLREEWNTMGELLAALRAEPSVAAICNWT